MHFALVHGAYNGAWCWDRLRAALERDGHTTSAADLPCEDPDAGVEQYADAVVHSIPDSVESVVLVGHSLAGLTIPVVAERTPTMMTVYLCALLPVPGTSFDSQHAEIATGFEPSEKPVGHPDGSAAWPERGAIEVFYQDCDLATRELLAIDPLEMAGGHSPFLSRTGGLAAVLQRKAAMATEASPG